MEGAVEREREVMDLVLFMLHVLPVLVVTLLAPFLGFSLTLLLQGLVLSYIFWIQKGCSERERLQIQVEERKKINAKKSMTEGESLRWMNEGVKAMWPISMEKFVSKHFFIPMAPWFLKRFKPSYVKEVTLQSLHLGSTPPHFSLIRALPSPQDGDDVVFEANMEFLSGKDMNAEMTVQMRGMKITFHISKLYMKGMVKFSVKFVKGWPVIGRVRFSFAHTPIVDMTARPWGYGPDMRFIPGAANWLEETLGTALEQSVVEPYMLAIDFEKLVSNMMFSDRMHPQGLQEFFSVEPKSGFSQTVLVEILEAGDLKSPNGAGFPYVFVEVTLGTHKLRTKSQTKTLKPVWKNEVQRIPIVNWALPNLLTLQVISKRSMKIQGQRQLGICSVSVNDYRNGERHVKKITLENDRHDPTGWILVAVTVENSQGVEEPAASIGSQPTTRDLESISPPLSVAATTISAPLIHTRSTSTEDVAAPHEASEEGGSSEIIKMPYGTDGAFSIEFPGEEEPLYFSDPPTTGVRKPKNEKAAFESKDRDARVKRSMMRILRLKKRSTSKVSQEISPPEREMTLSEHSGYSSSLDHSTELKIYHGAVNLNLLSPEMPSREPPHGDIRPLRLETVLSENREVMKTPDLGHGHNNINSTEPQPHQEVKGSSFSRELIFSSQREQEPEKQNSKNSWWKSWTKRPKRRTTRGSSKPNTVSEHDQPEYVSYDPSDTSASQSFRKEPQDIVKELLLQPEDTVTTTDNGHSILTCGRSKSCRQDSHSKKVVSKGGLSKSMRVEPSPSLLKTIHEKQGLDRPQH